MERQKVLALLRSDLFLLSPAFLSADGSFHCAACRIGDEPPVTVSYPAVCGCGRVFVITPDPARPIVNGLAWVRGERGPDVVPSRTQACIARALLATGLYPPDALVEALVGNLQSLHTGLPDMVAA